MRPAIAACSRRAHVNFMTRRLFSGDRPQQHPEEQEDEKRPAPAPSGEGVALIPPQRSMKSGQDQSGRKRDGHRADQTGSPWCIQYSTHEHNRPSDRVDGRQHSPSWPVHSIWMFPPLYENEHHTLPEVIRQPIRWYRAMGRARYLFVVGSPVVLQNAFSQSQPSQHLLRNAYHLKRVNTRQPPTFLAITDVGEKPTSSLSWRVGRSGRRIERQFELGERHGSEPPAGVRTGHSLPPLRALRSGRIRDAHATRCRGTAMRRVQASLHRLVDGVRRMRRRSGVRLGTPALGARCPAPHLPSVLA
jgi:hypothetical protein